MNDLTVGIVFTALTSAIAALFGFVVWLIKAQIAKGDACCAQKDQLYAEAQELLKSVQAKNDQDLDRYRQNNPAGSGPR